MNKYELLHFFLINKITKNKDIMSFSNPFLYLSKQKKLCVMDCKK